MKVIDAINDYLFTAEVSDDKSLSTENEDTSLDVNKKDNNTNTTNEKNKR